MPGEVVPFEAPKRRTRKKEEVSFEIPFKLDLPGTAEPSSAIFPIVREAMFTRLDPTPGTAVQGSTVTIQTIVPEFKTEPSVSPTAALDATQIKGFRDRLFKYTNNIFPKAGMVPSVEGGGIAQKVRAFAQAKFKVPLTNLSVAQWESLFSHWDGMIKEHGATALVKVIDDVAEGRVKIDY